MTIPISAATIFCDSVRDEKSGASTYVGVVTDNLAVGDMPGMLARLTIYSRIIMPVDSEPQPIDVVLSTNGVETSIGNFDKEKVRAAMAEAAATGSAIVTFLTSAASTPFVVNEPTRLRVFVRIPNVEIESGNLKINSVSPTSASV
jgi:hypothetical protein